MNKIIELHNLTKTFGNKKVVNQLSFDIEEGKIFGLLGPNGAGKTTTLRMLSCLMTPSSGYFQVMSHTSGKDNEHIRHLIGAVTESPGLYDRLSIWDNLAFYGSCYRMGSKVLQERIDELLNLFELKDDQNQLVGKLSKGMKQKVSIIRALLHNPTILFLDEATANLDPVSIKKLKDLVKGLAKEGKTIVYCSHALTEIDELCDEFAIIKNKLITLTTPKLFREKWSDFNILISVGDHHQTSLEIFNKHENVVEIERNQLDFKLKVLSPETAIPQIIKELVVSDVPIQYVQPISSTLEEAYFSLLQKEEEFVQ